MPLLNVGDTAPAFSVQNQDGEVVTLDQYRVTSVVMWWYPKADTPG
ncbi:MAG: hypothetical protein CME13_17525 [Gemmatimonadetes bacterium]|jgi:peroxiredoxin Q/BCP|nr:hypothetical protein [Gemmatimonadota bacterium]|tara:strand:+ start:415 stop:552 length:138 start_codon:yes stop_codon:yes gene_type:complete